MSTASSNSMSRIARRPGTPNRPGIAILVLTMAAVTSIPSKTAGAQTVKIVGIGAGSCEEFLGEIRGRPDVEKNFFAWAQGYMSGLLIRAPVGKDEDLDLAPPRFPLLKQVEFLREYCSRHGDEDYSDAVNMLYRTLRAPSG